MSYSETRSDSVHYSGSAHYSGSQGCSCGKSVSYSGSVPYSGYVPVYVEVIVNTEPFDSAVNNCEATVAALTGSIATMKVAQINEIRNSAKEISHTIINGFFKTVSSEISQQIVALENEANSSLLHLMECIKKVQALKERMEKDYRRITERYVDVFQGLNNELVSRIGAIDSEVFEFEKIARKSSERFLNSDLSNTASVFGKENAFLSAKISIASAKNKAFSAINKARDFLFLRKKMDNIIQSARLHEALERAFYVPSCFVEMNDKSYDVHLNDENASLNDSQMKKDIAGKFKNENLCWQNISDKECEQISMHLNACINEKYNSSEPKIKRIREMLQKLVNLQGVQICKS